MGLSAAYVSMLLKAGSTSCYGLKRRIYVIKIALKAYFTCAVFAFATSDEQPVEMLKQQERNTERLIRDAKEWELPKFEY